MAVVTAVDEVSIRDDAGSVRDRVGYAIGETGNTLGHATVNTFLLFFLVSVAELSPLVAGSVFVLGRLVDAVIDPVVGDLVDRHAHERARTWWIRRAVLPLGVSFALLWWLPTLAGPRVVWALVAFVAFAVAYTFVAMPYLTLTPVLAPGYDARTRLSAWRMGASTLVSIVAIASPPLLVAGFGGVEELGANPPSAWLAMGTVLAVVALAGYAAFLALVREPAPAGAPRPERRLRLATIREVLSVRATRSVVVLFLVVTVALMIGNSVLPFFLESVLGLDAAGQTAVLAGLFVVAVLLVPVWTIVSERLGKGRALAVGILPLSAGLLALAWLRPGIDDGALLWFLVAVSGVGLSAVIVLPWAIIPDAIEFDEAAHGVRRDGLVFSLVTFGQKLAGSVGVFATSIAATVFGYVEGTPTQSPATVDGLAWTIGPMVVAVYVLAAVLALRLPITRESFAAARAAVDARHARVR